MPSLAIKRYDWNASRKTYPKRRMAWKKKWCRWIANKFHYVVNVIWKFMTDY